MTPQFQRSLQNYIKQLQSSRAEYVAEIKKHGGTAPAPLEPIVDSPAADIPPAPKPEGTTARERAAAQNAPAKRKLKATKVPKVQ
jgi:hypothetical protein